MAERKNYLNKIFVKRVWRDNNDIDNELFSIGVARDEFIQELKNLPVNERGFSNLTMGARKDDMGKFSIWLDTRQTNTTSTPTSSAPKSQSKPTLPGDDNDDLPF